MARCRNGSSRLPIPRRCWPIRAPTSTSSDSQCWPIACAPFSTGSATSSLLSRRDVVVVASVSCIYGIGSAESYHGLLIDLKVGVTYGSRQPIDLESGEIGLHSTPTIAKDVIVIADNCTDDTAAVARAARRLGRPIQNFEFPIERNTAQTGDSRVCRDVRWQLDDDALAVTDRRAVFEGLRARGIAVQVHYIPIHTQPYYRALGFAPGDFPASIQQPLATARARPSVIWLHFQECTGCTESLLRTSHPALSELLLDLVSLDYHETLFAAAGLQLAFDPGSVVPSLGASGAIGAVLGAYLVLFPRARVTTLVMFIFISVIQLPAIAVLGMWFLLQLLQGVGSLGARVGGGVAYWAHVGGFAFGALL